MYRGFKVHIKNDILKKYSKHGRKCQMCKKSNSIAFAMGILAGVAGGVLLGVVFAPKSGEESRKEVKEAFKTIVDKCNPEINKVKEQAIDVIKSTKYKIEAECKKIADNIKAEKLANAKKIETDVYNM